MLFKKHIGLLIFVFANVISRSQNCDLVLKGTIRDKSDNEGLGFAVIKIVNTGQIFQANENGEFQMEKLCPGMCMILVKHMGCRDTVFNINQLKFRLPGTAILENTYFQLNNSFVAKQWRVPANTDFAPPPAAYYLLGFDIGTQVNLKGQKILVNFGATNLLNTRYREYLDRFRYYCDAAGVSYNIRLTVPIVAYNKKNRQR